MSDRGESEACPHCSPFHGDPNNRAWGVFVGPQRDGDGQPVFLYVCPSNGAHVSDSDAQWLREVIADHKVSKARWI